MKKTIAILLAVSLISLTAACGTGDLYIHDGQTSALPPATEAPEVLPEVPAPLSESNLGSPVIFNVLTNTETYQAPDDSGKIILSYGYNDVDVYLENNGAAADAINQVLARQDEVFYSGSDAGSGVNAMLERAIDNYSLAMESGVSSNTEFSCMRSAFFDRGDSRVISIRYRVNSFTGGAHGDFTDRAYVFDTASGKLLTLDDLSSDRAALEQAILDRMNDLIQNDIRYQTIADYMKNMRPEDDMQDSLKALIREGSWLLDNEGLVVFSDIYEIGSYADGIIRFTLSYDELTDIIKDEYFPVERTDEGELLIRVLEGESADSIPLIDKVTISPKGSEFRVYAQGTVYDVTIDSVTYINDSVGFYQTDTHWFCSYLSNAGVQVQTLIPEGMPNLMIRYRDTSGDLHSYLVSESGKDGSVLLLEQSSVEAVG